MAITKIELDAIARCCFNSAVMLDLADSDAVLAGKRARFRALNQSQAGLLRIVGSIAEAAGVEIQTAEASAPNTISLDASAQATYDLFTAMREGKRIEAIQAHRTLTHQGLKESKEAVEAVMDRMFKVDA